MTTNRIAWVNELMDLIETKNDVDLVKLFIEACATWDNESYIDEMLYKFKESTARWIKRSNKKEA